MQKLMVVLLITFSVMSAWQSAEASTMKLTMAMTEHVMDLDCDSCPSDNDGMSIHCDYNCAATFIGVFSLHNTTSFVSLGNTPVNSALQTWLGHKFPPDTQPPKIIS